MDSKTLVLFIISAGCLALLGASVGGNAWIDYKLITMGLWKRCSTIIDVCTVRDWDHIGSKLHAARAFASMAIVMAAIGTIGSFVRLIKDSDGKAVSAFFLGAGVCMTIAVSVFTSEYRVRHDYGAKWGWSYILGWIGAVATFVVSGLVSCLK